MKQNNNAVFLKLRQPGSLLFAHFFLSAACGFLFFMPLLTSVSSTKKMFFIVIIISMTVILLASSLYFLIRSDHASTVWNFIFRDVKNRNALLRLAGIGFVFCWAAYFVPPYLIAQTASGYLQWFKPFLGWAIVYFSSAIVIIHLGDENRPVGSDLTLNRSFLQAALFALLFFLIVLMFTIGTGFGISVQEDYWYGAGVPVLWIQILAAIFIGITVSCLMNHLRFLKEMAGIDIVIFILLWGITALVWAKEPLQSSHFMPDTGINDLYPYSDSATFDIGSQYALIGQGLFNGLYFDRSLYSAFLTYLHVFAGQNTETLMSYQAVVYAVFPAILYLLGRELHGYVLGISLGSLILFRGVNSIFGTSLIDLAGPKMMLTDFPTAIGISLVMLFIVKWLKRPAKISNVIWAGCFIGLTLLLRTHVILLLPFIIVYKIIYFKNSKTVWIYGLLFLILGMIISTLPLDFQNQKKGVPMFYMYYSRIEEVLRARYRTPDSPNTDLPEKSMMSAIVGRERLLVNKYQKPDCSTKLCAIGNHFFHNLAGSVLSLPASFVFNDFRHTVKGAAPYWGKDWIGEGVDMENYLLLFINLIVISVGIGAMWTRRRLLGLFPLVIYTVYILSNSLAFTSGGRYLTPVDWIIHIYYMLGLLKISFWLLRQTGFDFEMNSGDIEIKANTEIISTISFRDVVISFAAVLMIGSLLPLADSLYPRRYNEINSGEVLLTLTERGLLEKINLTEKSVEEFLMNPNARLISGRLLYPRFYPSAKGEPGLDYPYTALDYRRLVFMVIGSFGPGANGVILPIESPPLDLHASDVIVLGCTNHDFLDAVAVFILSQTDKVYTRPAMDLVLQCPLPNP